jgi:hypothetical protein
MKSLYPQFNSFLLRKNEANYPNSAGARPFSGPAVAGSLKAILNERSGLKNPTLPGKPKNKVVLS